MTNIEFLVNELRKANETIDSLRKEIARVKAMSSMLHSKMTDISLDDIDALESLVKKFREM